MGGTGDSNAEDKIGGPVIDGMTFYLPCSAALCLEGTWRFLRLISGIPSRTPDIAKSLVSYLLLFDSRCRQLVLCAGAIRSAAKLPNITTAHLALASQALSFLTAILPYIQEFVQRQAHTSRLSADLGGEFDKVRRALQEHQDAIYQKLVEIMASRARLLSRKACETVWDQESSEDVRKYAKDLAKDTTKLSKVLNKYLPNEAVDLVMVPVFASYKDSFGDVFREVDLHTETGRDW